MWFNVLTFALTSFYPLVFSTIFTTGDYVSMDKPVSSGYSEIQLKSLKQFRVLVSDITSANDFYKTDTFLLRWLRANNFKVNPAYQMFRQANAWREENHIDNILEEKITPGEIPYTFEGYDKEGRPVLLLLAAKNDIRKAILSGKRATVRFFDQMLEFGFAKIKNVTRLMSDGEPVTQFIAILDFKGINFRQHLCVQCMLVHIETTYHYENYYPESCKYIVLINVDKVAKTLVEVIKPLMSAVSRTTLKVFGTDKSEWSSYLRLIIDEEQLPLRLGGTRTF